MVTGILTRHLHAVIVFGNSKTNDTNANFQRVILVQAKAVVTRPIAYIVIQILFFSLLLSKYSWKENNFVFFVIYDSCAEHLENERIDDCRCGAKNYDIKGQQNVLKSKRLSFARTTRSTILLFLGLYIFFNFTFRRARSRVCR